MYTADLNPASYKYLVINGVKNKCTKYLKSYCMDGRDFILSLAALQLFPSEVIMNLPASATDFLDVFIGYFARYRSAGTVEAALSSALLPRIHVYGFSTAVEPVQDLINRAALVMRCEPSDIVIDTLDRGALKESKKRKLTKILAQRDDTAGLSSSTTTEPAVEHDDERAAVPISVSQSVPATGTSRLGVAHIVRDVAPSKVMICLSFILPEKVYTTPFIYLTLCQNYDLLSYTHT